jgi:glycosyltransferase involved in cell wall biosynthesis
MKIGIITTSFPRWEHDYVAAFIYEAARAIQHKGFQIKVITMHSPGAKRHETWDGIEIYRTKYLPERWELLKSEGGGLPEVWKKNPKARIQIIPFIIAFLIDVLIYTRDCEVIHANWTLSGAVAWMYYLFVRKPYLVTIHGSDIYRTRKWPVIKNLTSTSLRAAKKVIVVSRALAEEVNSIGVPYSKIEVIPDGVDTNYFTSLPFEERANTILFVGSIIERKGVRYLIQAFTTVIKQYPDAKLILMGEGPQQRECEGLVQSLGIVENVIFTGAQSQERVAEGMRRAKIFVLPSVEEGLGVVLLESLASGTPIIASKVGGISDVVDEKVGILVTPADPQQLGKAINTILSLPPEDWRTLNQNARMKAENDFDWARIAQRIVNFYLL